MKKILFTLMLLSLPVMIKATGQMAEILSINGEYWQLYYCPIETNRTLSEDIARVIKSFPETITEDSIEWVKDQSTDLWRNYIAEWEIKDNRLFLREVDVAYTRKSENGLEYRFLTLNEETLKGFLRHITLQMVYAHRGSATLCAQAEAKRYTTSIWLLQGTMKMNV